MIYTTSCSHSHVQMDIFEDDKEVWTPPLTAHVNFADAQQKIEDTRSSIQEWSKWFEMTVNDTTVWYVYVTLNWRDGTKSFKTWRIDGVPLQ